VAVNQEPQGAALDAGLHENLEEPQRTRHRVSTPRLMWEWTKSILVAFSLFLLIRTFVVEAFRIPTGSMEQTLRVGDFLLVNKAVYGAQVPGTTVHLPAFKNPRRGDIVVFVPPHEPDKNYVKRLIGLPGDTLEMHHKLLVVNGDTLDERAYVQYSDFENDVFILSMLWQSAFVPQSEDGDDYRPSRDNWGPIVVPQDRFFVLGDNRDDSEDSRYWGFVDRAAMKGSPLFVYYSFDPSSLRPFPWLTQIRWARIGEPVH
jgi:signal peptidase I